MTTKELSHVLLILMHIKNPTPKVDLAIAYIRKDMAVRDAQRDNFKGDYESDGRW